MKSTSLKRNQKALPLWHQRGIVKEVPAELLPAAITESLILAFHIGMTARTNRENRVGIIEGKMLSVVHDLYGDTVGKLLICSGESQQFVRRSVKPNAELLQCVDSRSGFSACNGTKVSWTEIAEFRSGFVGKITAVADAENRGRKFLGEHGDSSPSV